MTIKDVRGALRTFLLADSVISTAVGGARIYPIRLPAGVPAGPAVVYSLISEETNHHLQGSSGLVTSRYQIDAWATSSELAQNLALLLKERLDGYRGPMVYGTNSPQDEVEIRAILAENARHDYDPAANLQRASRDYFVSYAER